MRAGPRGASASPSDRPGLPARPVRPAPAGPARTGPARAAVCGRVERLRKPEQFAALVGDRASWRQCLQWICVSARFTTPDAERDNGLGVRVGFTVAKRQAKRAVMRAMVKRIMKESVRAAQADLAGRAAGRGLHAVMRLRSPLPAAGDVTLAQLKRALRTECDALLARLIRHLERNPERSADPGPSAGTPA